MNDRCHWEGPHFIPGCMGAANGGPHNCHCPDEPGKEQSRLRRALERELEGARRAKHEAERQSLNGWPRHFQRMIDRIRKALDQ
jgi:hypothetical protein